MSQVVSCLHRGTLYLLLLLTLPALSAGGELGADGGKPPLSELIILLAATPEPSASEVSSANRSTPETLVAAINARAPLTGAFVEAPPEEARLVLSQRAKGALRTELFAAPDTPRARLERYIVLRYQSGTDLEAIATILRTDPRVLHVELNREVRLHLAPSDPFFPQTGVPADHQWGLHAMNLPAAWDLVKGNAYLGVVDTGLDVDHRDLRPFPSYIVEAGECSYEAGNFEGGNFRPHFSRDTGDDDCNVDDNTAPPGPGNSPSDGHGTHVAGILAATTDNALGIAGHCWHCPIMMAKAREDDGSFLLDDIVEGLNFLVDKGAQSVSMSFGYTAACPGNDGIGGLFCDAIAHATARDVVLAGSDGNDKTDIEFPASDDRVIAVGGVQPGDVIWDEETIDTFLCPCDRPDFSHSSCNSTPTFECGTNFMVTAGSAEQDVVAPARTIVSTFTLGAAWNAPLGCSDEALPPSGDGYGLCTGTSMSSPAVSAIIGLVRSANPLLLRDQAKSILLDHASMAGSGDPMFGNGIPDAAASVAGALGEAGGALLKNRLTPLFNLWSPEAETHLSTTIPQQAQAALFDPEVSFETLNEGERVPGYAKFPEQPNCPVGPCRYDPRAYAYVLTTDVAPFLGAPELVPLYRMSFDADFGGNPLNRSYFYTTETVGINRFKTVGYRLDGIEGYLYKRCTPEPSCIPTGATRLYRLYHVDRDDYAIFPESRLAEFQNQGYISQPGLNDWLGYVYELTDSDGDQVIDGFEGLIGTNPSDPDSDDDGMDDGEEVLHFPYSDPLSGAGRAQLEAGSLTVGGTAVTVQLANTYVSPVVVTTMQYSNSSLPTVTRVMNVGPTSFQVRLQNPSGGPVVAENVSYLVVEEGSWTIDGVNIEAQKVTSTVTDHDGSWTGQPQSYGHSFTNPVVLGQVMSENDPGFSVFWAQGAVRTDPPSASTLRAGKTVCEDPDLTRADETVGFVVFEAGHGVIGGVEFEAGLGADTVAGVDNAPPYTYSFDSAFASAPTVALLTMAGVDGANGGWAQAHGPALATTTSLFLSIDEDIIGDAERSHTREQVGYVAFTGPVFFPAPPQLRAEWGNVFVGGGSPIRVNLTKRYINPVVVTTISNSISQIPLVTRVSKVDSSSFDVRLQNPGDGPFLVALQKVSYLVVEAGDWTINGVKISASTYNSTVTDENNNWVGQAQFYGQSFVSPVVLGQVMSENDPGFSVFWSQGAVRTDPPSGTALTTGKTVCEDSDLTRADETVGIIVIETAHTMLGGVEFEAMLGADTVAGVGDQPPYNYTFNSAFGSAPEVALATMAGVDGGNGGWAHTYGTTATTLSLAIDEDRILDDERNHTTEQVGYVVFETPGAVAQ